MFYTSMKWVSKIILCFIFRIEVIGMKNFPKTGPVIVAANHTSNYDPVILFSIFNRKIHFLAKKELFQRRISNWFFQKLHAIPVDRQSGIVIRPVRRALKVIENGGVLGIFPEGKRCKNGEIVKPKKGVAFLGIKTGAPVLPVAIVYLDTKKRLRKTVKIVIGPMMYLDELESFNYTALAEAVMNRSRELREIHE
ncbi:lysophospholipid acyltransferase family protein [Parageobacillus thermoglucosidasius]|uniref:1-acyl-sn-glycerol-3-phosphate acyltransferase n=1 Tax=Parageobacillus thermoglucosidasius TaxID=1426 RepID=A0AB38QZI4_PARTM|nr:lysophospholipid acyltransferase family protein [Parageobacillus thermoglucosidasius]UOE75864.1 1-acyl-sn-glycerol-3-phosphate acyltransferase [Parageobacillus thermoglucosidasius]